MKLKFNKMNSMPGMPAQGAPSLFQGTVPLPQEMRDPAPQQQQQQTPPTAPQPSHVVPGTTVPNSNVSTNPQDIATGMQNTAQATGGQSPMDKYAHFLDNGDKSGGQQGEGNKPEVNGEGQPSGQQTLDLMGLEVSHFQKAAGNMSFINGIDSEMVQKAMQGDGESFMTVINQVAQNAYAQSVHGSSRLSGTAMNQQFEQFGGKIPGMLREHQINHMAANADLNHPTLRPLFQQAVSMFAQQYPNATPEQVQKAATEYMHDAAKAMVGTPDTNVPNSQQGNKQADFSDFFS